MSYFIAGLVIGCVIGLLGGWLLSSIATGRAHYDKLYAEYLEAKERIRKRRGTT